MTIGVVVAHPDDEVLGCGGTIARFGAERKTSILILGEGITSRSAERTEAVVGHLRRLHEQARVVADMLGVRSLELGGLPDNRFDSVDLLDIVGAVERWIDRVQPRTIITHHPGDLNIDHAQTFRAVLTATRPVAGCPVRSIYACEVPSATEWAFGKLAQPFQPNTFVDISATLERKIQAMEVYATELRPAPHPRSSHALRAIATRWGSVAGLPAAEAFELIRSVHP